MLELEVRSVTKNKIDRQVFKQPYPEHKIDRGKVLR